MTLVLLLLFAAAASFEESFRAGLLALQRQDFRTAANELEAASQFAPNNGRVWIALAQTYRKLNEPAKADRAAGQAEKLGVRDALVQKSLAIYYSEAGIPARAAAAQAAYATLTPQDPSARERAEALYFAAAQPLLQQQKFGEAIALLTQARTSLSGSAQLELALGVAYYGMRRFDDAATAFLATIALAPETEQPYQFLGKSLDQIPQRLPDVTRVFRQYVAAHPTSSLGYVLEAKALNAQSLEPEKAQKLIEKAIELDPRDAAAHFELGALYFRQRRYADSALAYERSAELDPRQAATHYRLANVYSRLGKTAEAQAQRELHAQLVREQESSGR